MGKEWTVHNPGGSRRVIVTKELPGTRWLDILTAADCIRGKRVTTISKCAMDAEQGGATYVDEDVVVDGLLVTGRGYQQNTAVLREFIRMLKEASKRR